MSEEKKFRVARMGNNYGKNYKQFREMLEAAHKAGATTIEMYDASSDALKEKAARVAQLEAEIAELKQKLASDQMWIREISGSVKAGLWEPFLQSSLSAGIAHGRAISTSLEREARTQKLVEALVWYADEEKLWFKKECFATGFELASRYDEEKGESVVVPLTPGQSLGFKHVPRAALQVDRGERARQALAEYRGEIPESGKEE